ncbi:MAG: MFS transporter, partial [Thermoplasmatota archaeon]
AVFGIAIGPFAGAALFALAPDLYNGLALADLALVGLAALAVALTFALPAAQRPGAELRVDALASAPRLGGPGARAASVFARFPRGARNTQLRGLATGLNAVYLALGLAYGLITPYFATFFFDALHGTAAGVGVALGAGTIAAGASGLALAVLVARLGERRLLLAGALLATVALATLAFATDMANGSAAYVARYFFAGLAVPALNGILMRRALPSERGRIMGESNVAWNAGWATGAAVGGIALATLGGLVFPLGGLLALAAVAPLAIRRGG